MVHGEKHGGEVVIAVTSQACSHCACMQKICTIGD